MGVTPGLGRHEIFRGAGDAFGSIAMMPLFFRWSVLFAIISKVVDGLTLDGISFAAFRRPCLTYRWSKTGLSRPSTISKQE